MLRLFCNYSFLISPSFCAFERLCFMLVKFLRLFTYNFVRIHKSNIAVHPIKYILQPFILLIDVLILALNKDFPYSLIIYQKK